MDGGPVVVDRHAGAFVFDTRNADILISTLSDRQGKAVRGAPVFFPDTMTARTTICAFLLGIVCTTAQSQDPPIPRAASAGGRFGPPVRVDTWIRPGVDSLEATYYIPSIPPPDSSGYPAMLFVHGFGGTRDWDTASASLWAASGYVTLCYSVRGHGGSSGAASIMGAAERADLPAVIRFLRSLPSVDSSKTGIQGGSQGGLHGLWAKIDSLPVRAVSADVISPLWASTLLSNGSIRRTMTMLLRAPGVRYTAERDTLWELVRADDYETLRTRFPAGRDVDTACLHASTLPLLSFLKWGDHYFAASDGITSFRSQRPPVKIYLGTGGHYSDGVPGELEYQWGLIARWFNQWLAGIDTGVLDEPPVSYAVSGLPVTGRGWFTWMREASATWPPAGVGPLRLFFAPESLLAFESPSLPDSVVVRNDWDQSYSFDDALAEGFTGPGFDAGLPRDTRMFLTPPLYEELVWAGIPRLHLSARPGSGVFPVHARIYEQDANGGAALINRINFVGRGWAAGTIDSVTVNGLAHAHRFSRGSRIRVELTNIDVSHAEGWGDAPFVLPTFRRVDARIYLGGSNASWIELPLSGTARSFAGVVWFVATVESGSRRVRLAWRAVAGDSVAEYDVEQREETGSLWTRVVNVPATGPGEYRVVDSTSVGQRRWYRLSQVGPSGRSVFPDTLYVDLGLTSVERAGPVACSLEQNYPNPFNPSTTLEFTLPAQAMVVLAIHNILGEEVARPVDGAYPAGTHSLRWDASRLPTGVYFARLTTPGTSITRPMLLIR